MNQGISRRRYDRLIELAYKDSAAIAADVSDTLGQDDLTPLGRARLHRVRGVALRLQGQLEDAMGDAAAAEELARMNGAEDLVVDALLDRASALTLLGRMTEASEAIDSAESLADDSRSQASCRFQRGFLLLFEGRLRDARPEWEAAAIGFERVGDRLNLRKTLQNLGGICTDLGDLEAAREYQDRAYELARQVNDTVALLGINQHRGKLASYRGDLPEALRILEEAERLETEIRGTDVPQHVTRAEVLTSAGLFAEARQLATQVAERNEAEGDSEHAGNAWLIASRAAMFDGDSSGAAELAIRAASTLEAAGRDLRVTEAKLLALQARAQSGVDTPSVAELEDILSELEEGGLTYSLAEARLLAGRIFDDAGYPGRARDALEALASQERGPIEMQVFASLAAALLAERVGDKAKMARAARTGLDAVDRAQEGMGAAELRMGVEKHTRDLGALALRAAVDSGRPRRVLAWMERTRARFLRIAPAVDGPSDPEIERLAAELRRTDYTLRDIGADQDSLLARRRRLQDQISRRQRLTRARRSAHRRLDVDGLVAMVGDRLLVEIADCEGKLHAVVVTAGKCRLVELGETEKALTQLRHIRFAMRRAARLGRDLDTSTLNDLDDLFRPVFATSSSEVVIVPPPILMALPWSWLPGLRSRQVVVNPSAELWWRAQKAVDSGPRRVVVAGGPDLDVAGSEVEAVAALHESPEVLAPGASVERVNQAMDGASLAHVAAHARFEPHNPMFSSLHLGDGDLNLYDIQRLRQPPTTVILSACDSGYSEARPGEELAGLASALLSIGARNVVASVGLVPDSVATSDLMVEVHRGLVSGAPPAHALSRAQSHAFEDPYRMLSAASFICVGA